MLISDDGRPTGTYDTIGNLVKDCKLVGDGSVSVRVEDHVGDGGCDVRKHILTSWERCTKLGLFPHDHPKYQKISCCELNDLLKKYDTLLKIAQQYLVKMSLILPKNNCIIGLGDKDGILLHVEGHAPELEGMGYQPGYIHTESNMGNNALGTCIYTKEPTVILGAEHFLKSLSGWAGFAVPIYNMEDELEAALMLMMPIELASQNILGMVMVAARGIEKELRLIHEKSQLANTNEMLVEFSDEVLKTASMLSHEVKNSLSNISAYVQLMQLEKILDNTRAEKILGEISRINKLVYDFKRLTKPVRMNFSIYSLNDILLPTIEIMKPKASIHGIQLNLNLPKEPVYIKADKNALQQVFINLIENAIQAMENGNGGMLAVELKYTKQKDHVIVSFKDSGPGIPKEQLNQIFKLFYTTKETGSGLGLSLCQSVIKYHGGEISVHSEVGKGSTFIVTLPVRISH